jgi:hypothetical protein
MTTMMTTSPKPKASVWRPKRQRKADRFQMSDVRCQMLDVRFQAPTYD